MVSTRARQYDPYAPYKDVPDAEIELSLSYDTSGAPGAVVFQARPKAATDLAYGDGATETTGVSGKKTHTYGYNGTYTVTATQGAVTVTEHVTVDDLAETVPEAPTGVTATDSGIGAAAVHWTAPAEDGHKPVVGYKIESTVDDGTTWVVEVADTGDDSEDAAGVATGVGTFKFRVTAINAVGAGAPSAKSGAVAITSVPDSPTAVTGVDDGSGTAAVSWTAGIGTGGSAITGYKIESTIDDGTNWVVEVADTTTDAVTAAGVPTGAGTFKFRVSAINTNGAGPPSEKSAAVTVT